jgi:hypothetical protein
MAVGYNYVSDTPGSSGNLLSEHWNGTAWTIDGVTTPAADLNPDLSGVSCTSASFCMAVGDYYTTNNGTSLSGETGISETWNGAAWKIHSLAGPGPLPYGVSCTASNACTAVGNFAVTINGAIEPEGAQGWNGTKWSVETTVNPGTTFQFAGISCTAAKTCTAVGSASGTAGSGTAIVTLAEAD